MLWKFIKQCLLLCLPILIGLLLYCWKYRAFFPDPKYSNNVALNMKLQQGLSSDSSLDIVSMGSSMNLNNLASAAVKERWPNASYYNFGYWGCDLSSIHRLLPLVIERKRPQRVIITTNLMDFAEKVSSLDTAAIRSTLECDSDPMRYLTNWNAPFYLRNMESNRIRFTDKGNYEYLGLDSNGGSTLEVPRDRISQIRFDAEPTLSSELNEEQYLKFDSLAAYLLEQNVELIVLQSPYRVGVIAPKDKATINAHTNRLRSILDAYNHTFLNSTDNTWEDALFGDSSHLNGKGALAFSRYCLNKL